MCVDEGEGECFLHSALEMKTIKVLVWAQVKCGVRVRPAINFNQLLRVIEFLENLAPFKARRRHLYLALALANDRNAASASVGPNFAN